MSAQRTFRRYRGWMAAGILALVAVGAFLAFRQSDSAESRTTYQTEAAQTGTLSVTVSGTGNLEVDGTTEVYPRVTGSVDQLMVAKGDAVTTGTVLFTLAADDAQAATAQTLAAYRQAQQSVAQANAQLVKARNTLSDLESRYAARQTASATAISPTVSNAAAGAGGVTASTSQTGETQDEVTPADIENAEQDVETAQAGLASSKAQQSTALLNYEDAQDAEDDLEIASPCSGVVYSLDIEEDESVSASSGSSSTGSSNGAAAGGAGTSTGAGTAVSSAPVVIAPPQPLAVHLTVNEVDLPSLEVGQRADIEFDALNDVTATGKVYEIGEEGTVSSGVVTFDVWIALDVAAPQLRSGMSASATIVTEVARDALLVSNAAVKSSSDGSSYVQVLADGAASPSQVTVTTGLSSSTQTQILSGLAAGDMVVTSSSDAAEDSSSSSNSGFMMPGAGRAAGGATGMGGPPQ